MKHAQIRERKSFDQEVFLAAGKVHDVFSKLDIDSLAVSDYSKRYLKDYLPKLSFSLESICATLSAGIEITEKKRENIFVVESGGGVGIMSIVASLAGFRSVAYNDIFDVSCQDITAIATAFGASMDHVIQGDSKEIVAYCAEHNLQPDLVVSRNVIEHVYDIKKYLTDLRSLNPSVCLSFSTTANHNNFLVRIYTKSIHRKVEHKGIGTHWASKDIDAKSGYLTLRRNIIAQYYPELSEADLNLLARKTRGMAGEDIQRAIKNFYDRREIPVPAPGSNTSDPYTGNWAENLLPHCTLSSIYNEVGFELQILPGFWNRGYRKKYLRIIAGVFNRLIRIKPLALKLSPFIILVAKGRRVK